MKIPRKAPTLKTTTERQRILDSLPPWVVSPSTIAATHFKTGHSINRWRVYHTLAAHANRHTRLVRIGQQRIASALNLNRHTVGANLRKLEQMQLIARAYRLPPPLSTIVWRMIDAPNTAHEKPRMQTRNVAPRAAPE